MPKLGDHLVKTVDTVPFSKATSDVILSLFRDAGFQAFDQGHHLSIQIQAIPSVWECGCLYLSDTRTIHVQVLAKRWWQLWTCGDRAEQFERFWAVVAELEHRLGGWRFVQGTVAELKYLPPNQTV